MTAGARAAVPDQGSDHRKGNVCAGRTRYLDHNRHAAGESPDYFLPKLSARSQSLFARWVGESEAQLGRTEVALRAAAAGEHQHP